MKWLAKNKPQINDKRIIKRFLFFPKKINFEWRWLETAKIEQVYTEKTERVMDFYGSYRITSCLWIDCRWVNESEE